jgi:putative ABC transport system substrate-binding protein
MKRREFIALVGGVAGVWPLAARAQQAASQARLIAVLESGDERESGERVFRTRLAELGWQEGRNVKFEIRRGQSDIAQASRFAEELVAMKPDIFIATNTQMVRLIIAKTRDIPVVFTAVPDPIGSGLLTNFAHPEGNVTGFTNFEPSVAGKWLEFLKDVAPGVARVAIILQAENPTSAGYEKAIESAAPSFAVQVSPASLRDGTSIDGAIETFAREPNGAVIVAPSALATTNSDRIVVAAARHKLPAIHPYSEFTKAGGLMSYGFDRDILLEQAASYVSRILKGAHPGDLPVQRPTKYDLAINLKTAKALGLTVSRDLLLVADEVIE